MSVPPWWHPRAGKARLSPQARLIRSEARAARTRDPVGELQRLLTMYRMPADTVEHDDAAYELAGVALAALGPTLQRAKRLHEVSEWQFLEAVKRAAEATFGPIDFVPVRRRARVGRLDRNADPAIAQHLVTTEDLFSARRSAFVQRVRTELEKEAAASALIRRKGVVAEAADRSDSPPKRRGSRRSGLLLGQPLDDEALKAAERARVAIDALAARAGLSPRQAEALRLHRQFGPDHHEQVAREMGIGRGAAREHYLRALAKLREAALTA